jgi:hypothetical protein
MPDAASVLCMPKHAFFACRMPNALKHGFYSRRFSNRSFCGQECLDLETLSQDGLDSEIAMLRIVIRRVFDLSTGAEDLETVSRLLALLSLASRRIAAMLRVKVHLASNQPDEFHNIVNEAIDEA